MSQPTPVESLEALLPPTEAERAEAREIMETVLRAERDELCHRCLWGTVRDDERLCRDCERALGGYEFSYCDDLDIDRARGK